MMIMIQIGSFIYISTNKIDKKNVSKQEQVKIDLKKIVYKLINKHIKSEIIDR